MSPADSDGPLASALWFAFEAAFFTLAATLVVGVSAMLVAATLSLAGEFTDSRTISSVLALLVFVLYVGTPAYLLATRTDVGSGEDRGRGDGE